MLFYLQQKLEKKKEKEIEKQQYETKRQREKREYIALIEERKNRQRDILNKEVYTKINITKILSKTKIFVFFKAKI
jgi:hypothetical protein